MEGLSNKDIRSPWQLRAIAAIARRALYGQFTVQGLENLTMDRGEAVILACSHRNDHDMVAAGGILAPRMSLKVASMSSNFDRRLESTAFKIAGGDKIFTPIDYKIGENGMPVPGLFAPENYIPMQDSLSGGHSVMLAAHNPSRDGRLVNKPGIAVPYLAYISSASVVPVNVEFEGQDQFPDLFLRGSLLKSVIRRAAVSISIGERLELSFSDEESETISNSNGSRLSGDAIKILRQKGEMVMSAIRKLSSAP